MLILLRRLVLLLIAVLLVACSSGIKLDESTAPIEERSGASTTNDKANSREVTRIEVAKDPLNDPRGPLAKRSVYFDYDSYIVKDEFRPLIEAHAKYLVANKNRKVLIQGNTDERGGSEYNLALGQRRAEAVRKMMTLLGVAEAQLEAVSLGKEKPKALGHDEAAWAENRRVDLVYQ